MKNKIKNIEKAEIIKAKYNRIKDLILDSEGYFLIRVNKEKQQIEAGYCKKNNVIEKIITGKAAMEIFNTIIRENLISSLQHAADLGAELQKAEIALKHSLKYIQDDPLDIK